MMQEKTKGLYDYSHRSNKKLSDYVMPNDISIVIDSDKEYSTKGLKKLTGVCTGIDRHEMVSFVEIDGRLFGCACSLVDAIAATKGFVIDVLIDPHDYIVKLRIESVSNSAASLLDNRTIQDWINGEE